MHPKHHEFRFAIRTDPISIVCVTSVLRARDFLADCAAGDRTTASHAPNGISLSPIWTRSWRNEEIPFRKQDTSLDLTGLSIDGSRTVPSHALPAHPFRKPLIKPCISAYCGIRTTRASRRRSTVRFATESTDRRKAGGSSDRQRYVQGGRFRGSAQIERFRKLFGSADSRSIRQPWRSERYARLASVRRVGRESQPGISRYGSSNDISTCSDSACPFPEFP